MKLRSILCLALLIGWWSDAKAMESSTMTNQINEATRLLTEFNHDKSIDHLEKAFRAVERISPPGSDTTVPPAIARRDLAKMWLILLATLDQNRDPSYDPYPYNPTNAIALNSIAPPGRGGLRYPSGVAPRDIKEPEIREQYEAALKQNEEKAARVNFQIGL